MDEREIFPAFRILPSTARAFLATIDQAIGQGENAAISKGKFVAHGFGRGMVPRTLKRLVQLGFVTIEPGSLHPRRANVFHLSERWRELAKAEAKALAHDCCGSRAALATEVPARQVHPRKPPPRPATVDSDSGQQETFPTAQSDPRRLR
jgi:hypothetical protein